MGLRGTGLRWSWSATLAGYPATHKTHRPVLVGHPPSTAAYAVRS